MSDAKKNETESSDTCTLEGMPIVSEPIQKTEEKTKRQYTHPLPHPGKREIKGKWYYIVPKETHYGPSDPSIDEYEENGKKYIIVPVEVGVPEKDPMP